MIPTAILNLLTTTTAAITTTTSNNHSATNASNGSIDLLSYFGTLRAHRLILAMIQFVSSFFRPSAPNLFAKQWLPSFFSVDPDSTIASSLETDAPTNSRLIQPLFHFPHNLLPFFFHCVIDIDFTYHSFYILITLYESNVFSLFFSYLFRFFIWNTSSCSVIVILIILLPSQH